MKVLVVGAGAVGQVYGRHLALAGHDIHFFVKPKYAAELAEGMPLHRLGFLRQRSEHWREFGVVSDVAGVAATRWDQIWLCMASDALRSPLTDAVLAASGDATVVCLQPGPEDAGYVRERLQHPAQVVQGLITFISYQSPLPGQAGPAGIAYFLSPLAPGLFGGESQRTRTVVNALRQGGMAAKQVANLEKAAGGSEGVLIPLIAALEQHDWKLKGFAGSAALQRGRAATREALGVLAASRGASVKVERLMASGPVTTLLLMLAPRILPLALEPYLQYHFSKVGVQTRQMLASYIRLGDERQLPVENLRHLLNGLP